MDTPAPNVRSKPITDRKLLIDFVEGVNDKSPLDIEVVVDDTGKVVVFHSHQFTQDIGWFECDLDDQKFFFVFDDGQSIDSNIIVNSKMQKYMQNSHQILTVHIDHESGDAKEGHYYPLILQKR